MNYFYRMEERLIRWDKKLKALGKRRKRKTPKQKKRALRKRCAQMEKQSKRIVSQETFQEYYEEIFRNTLGVARKWKIIWRLYWALQYGWKLTKHFVNERYQHSVNRERIEWMQRLNYIFTFTYDDKKHTKCSFRKQLRRTLKHFGWQYIGVWKHSKSSNRLYFYAAIRINEGGMVGMNVKIKEYQRKAGKRICVIKNTYFSERFGSTVVNPLQRANRKLWKIVLGEINKKRAQIDARGIDKKMFIGDYEQWFRRKKHRRRT